MQISLANNGSGFGVVKASLRLKLHAGDDLFPLQCGAGGSFNDALAVAFSGAGGKIKLPGFGRAEPVDKLVFVRQQLARGGQILQPAARAGFDHINEGQQRNRCQYSRE